MQTDGRSQSGETQLVAVILRDVELLEELLTRWEEAGTTGATVLDCIGRTRLREALHMDDVPMFPSLADLMQSESVGEKLVFTIVSNGELTGALVAITKDLLRKGSTHKGLMFTVPLGLVFGLGHTTP